MATTFQQGVGDTDFLLSSTGRLVLETDPVVAAAIKLRNRFQFFKGEWWLDVRVGVPYFDIVFVKNPNFEIIRRLVRRIILSCPPIVNVQKLDVFYVPAQRICAFEFAAVASDGRIVSGGPGLPYLVDGN